MTNPVHIYRPKKSTQQTTMDKAIEDNRESIDQKVADMPKEYGGRSEEKGLEPTRYGDWELKGRCIDF